MLVFAAHELREKTDEWKETRQCRGRLLVDAVDFEPLIVEDDLSAVRGGNGVDP